MWRDCGADPWQDMAFYLQCFGNFETPSQDNRLKKAAETGPPGNGTSVWDAFLIASVAWIVSCCLTSEYTTDTWGVVPSGATPIISSIQKTDRLYCLSSKITLELQMLNVWEFDRHILRGAEWELSSSLRVWSWLRMNAGGVSKACKSNGRSHFTSFRANSNY